MAETSHVWTIYLSRFSSSGTTLTVEGGSNSTGRELKLKLKEKYEIGRVHRVQLVYNGQIVGDDITLGKLDYARQGGLIFVVDESDSREVVTPNPDKRAREDGPSDEDGVPEAKKPWGYGYGGAAGAMDTATRLRRPASRPAEHARALTTGMRIRSGRSSRGGEAAVVRR